jgi:hypothetical protein
MANIACDAIKNANGIVPRFIIDNDTITGQTALTLNVEDTLLFDPQPSDGIWRWTGPNGFSSESRQISINNIQRNQGGFYKAIHISPEGRKSIQSFIVTINECTKTAITPYMQVAGDWGSVTSGTVEAGGSVSFGPQPLEGTWEWSGPSGFTINSREFTLNNLKNNQEGEYIAQYYNQYGCKSTVVFNLTVSGEDVCRNNPINPYLNVNNVVCYK